ncbi:hypothetical protein HH213_07205 [Duganella dendranthematis]|jgi:hypothetical protein|uniref:Uncharacterized protein n=1 Tax=Duganella dendranthematis TaxID=2728021 RepID=A0ABX6M6H6_9BURK|nr:hypothetical protein [Duganella dendranthematis]QJD89904.1 hypothetical protein HH213_07205 [Duganella dendranthematis]
MSKHLTPAIATIFANLGFTSVDPATVMTDFGCEDPFPEDDTPAIFFHAGIDAYAAYAPEIVDGMYDGQLQELGAIAVVDFDSAHEFMLYPDVPLEVIEVKDLADFVAQRAFNPAYFDLRIAKRCVAQTKQELSDLEGDERPTREQFRKARRVWKEAVKHLRNLVVPAYQPVATI